MTTHLTSGLMRNMLRAPTEKSSSVSTCTLSLPLIIVYTRVFRRSWGNWDAAPEAMACVEIETSLERRTVCSMEICVAKFKTQSAI